MKTFFSISTRMLLMVFVGVAMLRTANASSLDDHFKAYLNNTIQTVKQTPDPDAKRKILENYLARMDQGIGMARQILSEKDGRALVPFQSKMRADLAALTGNGSQQIPNTELNHFADYVQQDVEQADEVVYIGGGGFLILLLILILLLR